MKVNPKPVIAARVRRGWSQVDLARESGVHVANISRLEDGHSSAGTIKAICDALNIDPAEVLEFPCDCRCNKDKADDKGPEI